VTAANEGPFAADLPLAAQGEGSKTAALFGAAKDRLEDEAALAVELLAVVGSEPLPHGRWPPNCLWRSAIMAGRIGVREKSGSQRL